ncbi:hypothetical protein A9R05_21740 [Burkholderia sp. KK1]|nr:hypothetical protein A9R05_21740 [Burkholderia sp. KK1]
MQWLGVDVGGTFTDLVLYDSETKRLRIEKVPSSTENQANGIMAGLTRFEIEPVDLDRMVHGTTVATNTALEMNGARMAVLLTKGHRDVLVVGRGNRTELYNVRAAEKAPLVPRSQCFEVTERLDAAGNEVTPLDEQQVETIAKGLAKQGVDAVAICFLHAYVNPEHEQRCSAIVAKHLPRAVVVTSSEVLPEYREYERFSTAALNAYVAPRMRRYLGDLEARLKAGGMSSELGIMTSAGGSLPASKVHALPVLTMLSGPAAGVIAASHIGKKANHPNLATFDMGGTSTDVCLVRGADFAMTTDGRVGVLPVRLRQIDIHTVAVGGGSIAEQAVDGAFSVGPRSAGSTPGPVSYGKGGELPTITDANVVLGRLSADRPLGKVINLDRPAARAAIARLSDKLGLGVEEMAEGILHISHIALANAIKEISIMRGDDPRDFALLPYGGAGPLHAADVAEELGMSTVVVPPLPGTFSALGLLIADVRRDFVRTRVSTLGSTEIESVRSLVDELSNAAREELETLGFAVDRQKYAASLDMRYVGQSFELPIPVDVESADIGSLETAFKEVYAQRYGSAPDGALEIVSYRLAAWGLTDNPELPTIDGTGRTLSDAKVREGQLFVGGKEVTVPIYDRDSLPLHTPLSGPALIEEDGSTTVLPPSWDASADEYGCLILKRVRD